VMTLETGSADRQANMHVFAATALGNNLRLRVGWYLLHSEPYNVSGFDSPNESDSQSFYVQLSARF